jgi:hypothetical protein
MQATASVCSTPSLVRQLELEMHMRGFTAGDMKDYGAEHFRFLYSGQNRCNVFSK